MVAYLSGRSQLTKPQRALGRLLPAWRWAPLKLSGGRGGESHTIPCLAWRVPETALDVWAERWRDGGIEVVAAARGHREGLD